MNKKTLTKAVSCLVSSLFFTVGVQAHVVGVVNSSDIKAKVASVNSNVLMESMKKGDEVHILGTKGEWFEVKYDNKKAMINKDDITYKGAKAKIVDAVNFRSNGELDQGNILKILQKGSDVYVLDMDEDFALISYNDEFGYVYAEKVQVNAADTKLVEDIAHKTIARVQADSLNVRKDATTNSPIVAKVTRGEELEVVTATDKWVQVLTKDGHDAYVSRNFIVFDDLMNLKKISGQVTLGQEMAEKAKQYLGRPYVYGGNSLTNGIDCSAFTQTLYRQQGINISRTSRTQFRDGQRVGINELEAGDLVFYGYNNYISHVAMYIGNGEIIHASSPKTGVKISSVYRGGKPYIGSVRILK